MEVEHLLGLMSMGWSDLAGLSFLHNMQRIHVNLSKCVQAQLSECARVYYEWKSLPLAASEVWPRQGCLCSNHQEESCSCHLSLIKCFQQSWFTSDGKVSKITEWIVMKFCLGVLWWISGEHSSCWRFNKLLTPSVFASFHVLQYIHTY